MKLRVTIEDKAKDLEISGELLKEAEDFFTKMDRDMDKGWQMGPEFIVAPTQVNRCQIAADKMLIAIDTHNEALLHMMAGYILSRMPDVTGINIDTQGEMLGTEIIVANNELRR